MVATNDEKTNWQDAVVSVLEGATGRSTDLEPLKVKKLRKLVLLSMQLDETDKSAKKIFKQTIQALETDGGVLLDSDGNVALIKKRKRKDDKKPKKKKKTEVNVDTASNDDDNDESEGKTKKGHDDENTDKDKNMPCKGNPQGVTRLFLGNLPFTLDETSLETFIPGLTHVKWITDKETGKFYGSAFVEMATSASAADAVAKAGTELLGRPIKINFAPAMPGDKWPPEKKVVTGGNGGTATAGGGASSIQKGSGQAGGVGIKAMSAKPDNCLKLFIGNLSYEIDDDGIKKFFSAVEAEVKAVRWLHHKDTGDFKGVYVPVCFISFRFVLCDGIFCLTSCAHRLTAASSNSGIRKLVKRLPH